MDNEIICYCKNVSKSTISRAIKNGAENLADIQKITGACTGNQCEELNPKKRCCSVDIIKILKEELGSSGNETKSCCCKGCR